jgi:hypothetical protein
VATMCISSSTNCSAYVPYAVHPTYTLAAASGAAQVYVYLTDVWGNATSTPLTDAINVDTAAPTVTALTATQPGAGRLVLSWSGTDTGIGIAKYTLLYAAGPTPPASCSQGTVLYAGEQTTFTQAGLAVGKHSYRVCALDRLGNASTGRTLVGAVR